MFLMQSRVLRLATLSALYFAQGITVGLLSIAMPAWLAEQGVSAVEIAGFVTLGTLPWAFKLVSGPFMDRFSFPAMGLRRPWVLVMQLGLILALLSGTALSGDELNVGMLSILAFAIASFAAMQDVAVDGMAILVLPEAERGRANAFMGFGQVLGTGVFGGISGWLLKHEGLSVTLVVAAAAVAVIWLIAIIAREHAGERLLPWSEGVARPGVPRAPKIVGMFRDILRALALPMSLKLTIASWLGWMAWGIGLVLSPVIAVQELGYASDEYSQFASYVGAGGALLILMLSPLIDRLGAGRATAFALAGLAVATAALGLGEAYWEEFAFSGGLWVVVQILGQVFFVGFIAQNMNMTWTKVAATQFAVYMAISNLAQSSGSAVTAALADFGHAQNILIISGLYGLATIGYLLVDTARHRAQLDALDAS